MATGELGHHNGFKCFYKYKTNIKKSNNKTK